MATLSTTQSNTGKWDLARIMTSNLCALALLCVFSLATSAYAQENRTLSKLNPDNYNLFVNSIEPSSQSCRLDARKSVPFRFVSTPRGGKLTSLELRVAYQIPATHDPEATAKVSLIASTAAHDAAYVISFTTSARTASELLKKWSGPRRGWLFQVTEDPSCADEARGVHLVSDFETTYE